MSNQRAVLYYNVIVVFYQARIRLVELSLLFRSYFNNVSMCLPSIGSLAECAYVRAQAARQSRRSADRFNTVLINK